MVERRPTAALIADADGDIPVESLKEHTVTPSGPLPLPLLDADRFSYRSVYPVGKRTGVGPDRERRRR